jgi:hypothetical protein
MTESVEAEVIALRPIVVAIPLFRGERLVSPGHSTIPCQRAAGRAILHGTVFGRDPSRSGDRSLARFR